VGVALTPADGKKSIGVKTGQEERRYAPPLLATASRIATWEGSGGLVASDGSLPDARRRQPVAVLRLLLALPGGQRLIDLPQPD
jgi:hypothetical protein